MKSPSKSRTSVARRHEALVAEMKASLARSLRKRRAERKLSQKDLAKRLGSSQSRVSKIEADAPEVSLDLLVRALIAIGSGRREIGRILGGG